MSDLPFAFTDTVLTMSFIRLNPKTYSSSASFMVGRTGYTNSEIAPLRLARERTIFSGLPGA